MAPPANLHFVPIDFAETSLVEALTSTSYDPEGPAFFAWLGVTMYLDVDTIRTSLRAIRRLAAPRSHLVLDYLDRDASDPNEASRPMKALAGHVHGIGEPFRGVLDPEDSRQELTAAGFRQVEDLGPGEIEARYFQGRRDGHHATEHAHLTWAVVD
jgi:methyltransferase (TIGR00027 family)